MSMPNTASSSNTLFSPTMPSSGSGSGTSAMNSTKRLSTIKTPGSPKATKGPVAGPGTGTGGVKDVVSPGELCGFVDTLLSQLETRFDEMSEQVLSKMNEMSTRIDNLEGTIQDLMTGDLDAPVPAPASKAGNGGGSRQGSISATPISATKK